MQLQLISTCEPQIFNTSFTVQLHSYYLRFRATLGFGILLQILVILSFINLLSQWGKVSAGGLDFGSKNIHNLIPSQFWVLLVTRYLLIRKSTTNFLLRSTITPVCGYFSKKSVGLFSALDKMVGEKGKITVYYLPKSPFCFCINVPDLYPICTHSTKQGKAAPNPALRWRSKSPMMYQIIMNVRDICPHQHGTYAHRLSSNDEIQLL